MTAEEALRRRIGTGYPVLLRPSYVLGGQNMIIAFSDDDVKEYMAIILSPRGSRESDPDRQIPDGQGIGSRRHLRRRGYPHSRDHGAYRTHRGPFGDSIAVYPAWNLRDELEDTIVDCSRRLAVALKTRGLVNIQYLIYDDELYVIEVNPRSSRTVPYISKVTGVPMVDLATRCMLGEKLRDLGYGTGLYPPPPMWR